MLLWLNGSDNSKDSPNENYAREMMELTTRMRGRPGHLDGPATGLRRPAGAAGDSPAARSTARAVTARAAGICSRQRSSRLGRRG
jgi:hypothetical protein